MNDPSSGQPTLDAAGHAAGVQTARAQVEAARLRHSDLVEAGRLLESADNAPLHPSREIPGYTVLREIHRGGQGIVYQALQQATHRKVAIKVLLEGADASKHARQRFEREIELVASLRHPNVISVFHSDQTADGLRFCVMDYVRGLPLTRYARENQLTLGEALRLFATVCEAVNHAHQKGVIHRDLKPSNILVDVEGVPRVLDFGLAKLVGGPEQSLVSMTGQVVGTLPYMSPEQTRGNPDEIDTRTDVYSLGVLFYELLTGRYPYPVVGQMADVLKHIAETEPTPPSRAWTAESGVLGGKGSSRIRAFDSDKAPRLGRLHFRRLPASPIDDEVQTIVLKALAKERERRYQSAGELARDIAHYLAGEPIEAKRDSAMYVLRKQLRRYRLPVTVAAGFAILTVASTIALWIMYRGQSYERRQAEMERDKAQRVAAFMGQTLSGVGPSVAMGRDTTMLREMMDAAAKRIKDGELKESPEAELQLWLTIGQTYCELSAIEAAHEMLDPAVDMAKSLYGDVHQMVAQALDKQLLLLWHTGRSNEGLPYAEAVLAIYQRLYTGDHPELAKSLDSVGGCLSILGRGAEALAKQEAALEMYRRLYSGDHENIADCLFGLGFDLKVQGKPDQALPRFEAALAMYQRLRKADHPGVAACLEYLGQTLGALGRDTEALPQLEAAVAMNERLYRGDHDFLADSLLEVGLCLRRLGQPAEALPRLEASLAIRQRLHKADNPYVPANLLHLAACLEELGRPAEAERYYRELLLVFRKRLESNRRQHGDEHPSTLGSTVSLGLQLLAQGKMAEAESCFRNATDTNRRVRGEDHPNTIGWSRWVCCALDGQDKLAEAEACYRQALGSCRRVLGEEDWRTLSLIGNMGRVLGAQGKPAEAIALLAPVEPAARRVFAKTPASSQQSGAELLGGFLVALGSARSATGLFDAAEANLIEAHANLSEAKIWWSRRCRNEALTGLFELYDAWNAAEPGKGHDAKAAEWRDKLDEWQATTQPAASMPTRSR